MKHHYIIKKGTQMKFPMVRFRFYASISSDHSFNRNFCSKKLEFGRVALNYVYVLHLIDKVSLEVFFLPTSVYAMQYSVNKLQIPHPPDSHLQYFLSPLRVVA